MIASTDCGMGSRIHPELGWAKLATLAEGARLATGRLWGEVTRRGLLSGSRREKIAATMALQQARCACC